MSGVLGTERRPVLRGGVVKVAGFYRGLLGYLEG